MMKIAFRVIFIFKMAANKIGKISMFSDFNENWYLGLFWSEELIGNVENCIQGHFYDATVSKMATNKIDKLLMVSDFNENWYLGLFEVRNWLVMMKFAFRVIFTILIWGSFGDFCVCIQTQSSLVIIIFFFFLSSAKSLSDTFLGDYWTEINETSQEC
jgi:hypothetical protein